MSGQTECPSLETLRLYLSGCIEDSAATPIHQHLTHCSGCISSVETISQIARPAELPLPTADEPLAGAERLVQPAREGQVWATKLDALPLCAPGSPALFSGPALGGTHIALGRYQVRGL